MRPVNKGNSPVAADGNPLEISQYQHARPALIKCLGDYCSYCEMQLDASLAVEHVKPKDANPSLALSWDNFLLSCVNCNATKGNTPVKLDEFFWPDKDNTFIAFAYSTDGVVRASSSLAKEQIIIAENTMRLVGLDKTPDKNPLASDRRWLKRLETWRIAEISWQHLINNNNDDMREEIVNNALGRGFWSIWMTVFKDDEDMLRRFITTFPGTSAECFEPNGTPVKRPGGQI